MSPAEPLEPLPPAPEATQTPELEGSLAEHEAQFGDPARRPAAEPEPDADPPRAARDRDDQGKFVKPEKHRAKSQQAGPVDVPRIQALTKQLRDAEAERDALRARVAPTSPPPAAPLLEVPRGTSPAVAATPDKPKIEAFTDYGDYVEALADWKIAQARTADRAAQQQEAEQTRITTAWRTRIEAAKDRYPDFDAIALQAPTTIPQGSLIDAWILEDTSGADVLYSLQKDPSELSRILALPIFEQVKALSLLAQRLSPSREPAVKTGAAATTPRPPAPRPLTPVRTSAMPAADEPPGDDASLAEHEKFFSRRRL